MSLPLSLPAERPLLVKGGPARLSCKAKLTLPALQGRAGGAGAWGNCVVEPALPAAPMKGCFSAPFIATHK